MTAPHKTLSQHITNVLIVQPGKQIVPGEILIQDGRITSLEKPASTLPDEAVRIDGQGGLLTPGLIDIHTHGIKHFLYESGPEGLLNGCRELAQYGVTTVIPTVVPQAEPDWIEKLKTVAAAVPDVTGVNVPGLHLEGPFLAIKGSAAATIPGDLELLDKLLDACDGHISAMSISPETDNILPVIHQLRELGITVFLTHTRASVEQTEAAIEAGAQHATHFYDVFYSPPEIDMGVRPVGVVEAVLADKRVSVDFIADGIHVHPAAIRAAIAAKGFQGVTLITDSNIGAGLPPDIYDTPWGYRIRVKDNDAPRHETDNYLAGSALTMDRGISNLMQWLDLPPEQVWAMGTSNPAQLLGLHHKGKIEVGADADLVLWDDNFRPLRTWVKGETVHDKAGHS